MLILVQRLCMALSMSLAHFEMRRTVLLLALQPTAEDHSMSAHLHSEDYI